MDLQELANVLEQNKAERFDFIAPASLLKYTDSGLLTLQDAGSDKELKKLLADIQIDTSEGSSVYTPTTSFSQQIAEKLGIDWRYFQRMMAEAPALLAKNVNHWLMTEKDKSFMVRAFNRENGPNIARAFLTSRFRVIDHIDVLYSALQAIKDSGINVEIQDCKLTEKSMYVRATCPDVSCDVNDFKPHLPDLGRGHRRPSPEEGFWITTGFVLKNSETGHGSFSISPLAFTLACTNYAVYREQAVREVHLGGELPVGVIEWSQETMNKSMELVMSQTKDSIKTFLSPQFLGKVAATMAKAKGIELVDPMKSIEIVGEKYKFTEEQRASILQNFIKDKEVSLLGISNAITKFAHEQDDADTQYELERVGADVLELSASAVN